MIKNYFITAWRNILKRKVFSIINIVSLSIGISAALFIYLIVNYENSYDQNVTDKERVYKVVMDLDFGGNEGHSAAVQAPLGEAAEREVAGLANVVPIFQFQGDATAKVTIGEKANADKGFSKQEGIVFTNDQYFSLLPYEWISGTAFNALQKPFQVVLSESRAKQYFGVSDVQQVIGRQLLYNEDLLVTVAGIVKDFPSKSSFSAKEFISLSTISETNLKDNFMMSNWGDWMIYSQLFVKLQNNNEKEKVEGQLVTLLNKNNPGSNTKDQHLKYRLQPVSDIHFNSTYQYIGARMADKSSMNNLLIIAGFLLFLGGINFVNLTTANSSTRAKEIGLRKTLGSSRKGQIFQFLGESLVFTFLAALLSLASIPLLFSALSEFIPEGLTITQLPIVNLILFTLIIILGVSILAGIYPAIVLSGFKPVKVLKGQVTNTDQKGGVIFRKSLSISQFAIAQVFIIMTVIVGKQISYSLQKDLGFEKEAILTFDLPREKTPSTNSLAFMETLKSIPQIQNSSLGFLSPSDIGASYTIVKYSKKPDLNENVHIRWGDQNYLDLYKIKLIAGRNVSNTEFNELIINQTYSKLLGFEKPEDALGEFLDFNSKKLPIVGVMGDFHEQSTRGKIEPLIFSGNLGSTVHIKLNPQISGQNSWQDGIAHIQKNFKEVYPEATFNYAFYDETIAKLYVNEVKTGKLLNWATVLSILISCLGLLGLIIYTINTRMKEIGIRKVLGASISGIVINLSKEFAFVVLISIVIAIPVAIYMSNSWLNNFAFQTENSWWIYVGSASLLIGISLSVLSLKTVMAARLSPVKSLRSE